MAAAAGGAAAGAAAGGGLNGHGVAAVHGRVDDGINMFTNDKVNVPILGLVENMAWFTPAELPENKYYIFGKEGAKRLAEKMNVPLLGQIPIVQSICESGDKGTPVALDENTVTGRAFLQLAAAVVRQVDRRNMEMAPTRIVEVHK